MKNESYEFIGEPDEAVGRLIAGLPRVEAPSDFEMRVRARIASGHKAASSWLTPLVRVAVPAALLVAIGGYFGYKAVYRYGPVQVPVVVSVPEPRPVQPQVESQPPRAPSTNELASGSPAASSPRPDRREEQKSPNRSGHKPRGGVYDIGGGQSKKPLVRRGQPTQPVQLSPAEGGPGISPKDVLETLGMTAGFTSGEWKVRSVTRNSLADKSGVKTDDVIEALDDQPLTERTVLGRRFAGESIRVRRDGRSIKLDLKP